MKSLTQPVAAVEAAITYNGTTAGVGFGVGARSFGRSAGPFGFGTGLMLGPTDLYRPLGLSTLQPHHHHQQQQQQAVKTSTIITTTATSATTSSVSRTSEFHQHRSPFAIHQLLGLGPHGDTKRQPTNDNDPMLSASQQHDEYLHTPSPPNASKTDKDYQQLYHHKLR